MIRDTCGNLKRLLEEASGGRWQITFAALLVIILVGGFLRFRGLDWDYPPGGASSHQHPDERFLSIVADNLEWPSGPREYLDTARNPLNPYNVAEVNSFVYGTFPLYLGKALTTIAGDDPSGPHNSYDTSTLWGRRLTAAVATASIALLFLVGLVLFGRAVALLSSLLYALSVLPIQLAHFWTVDPYVTLLGLITIFLAALLPRLGGSRSVWGLYAGIGVAIGLGMASKVAFWPLALAPVIETGARIGLRDLPSLSLRRHGQPGDAQRGDWMTDVAGLFLAAFLSLLVFRLVQPHAFTGPGILDIGLNSRWWEDLRAEAGRQSGESGLPWVIQFAGRPPYLESLKNMVLWGMGPALGVTAWAGLIAGAVAALRRRETALAGPVLLPLVFLFYFGGRFVVFMRYFAPVYPLLCLLAAWALLTWARTARRSAFAKWLQTRSRPGGLDLTKLTAPAAVAGVTAVVALTAWWALAFQNVYSEEHPRIQASRWLFENAPAGAGITNEIWDDALPMYLPGQPSPSTQFRLVPTEPYEPDSVWKISKLIYGDPQREDRPGLAGADYVVLASDRVRLSVPRLERRYPATIRYYELLESGALGFQPVATFRVRPSFLGISVDDSSAEESFSVYDHPTVRIYRKTSNWDANLAFDLLLAAYPDRAVDLKPGQGRTNGLQFTAQAAAVQQAGGTFSDIFEGGLGDRWPALWWFIWLELAAFAALPLTVALFRHLPDRGFPLTKLAGPLAVALIVWLLVAWDAFTFSGALVWGVFSLWLAGGVVAGFAWKKELLDALRQQWRVWGSAELLFMAVFAAFLALRAWNPDTWHHPQGGEKPMEMAYLTAVVRSTQLPPYDPWFAGGAMNYYYWGWFFLAVPIRALRILPEIAFNLAVPTFAALAASVAYSTAGNLAALSRQAGRNTAKAWRGTVATGLLGAFLLVFAGNFDGLHQTVERLQRLNTWDTLRGVPVFSGAIGIAGGLARFVTGTSLPPYDWWRSSRVHIGSFDITEFPYWSFTFADLHPHLMGLPFLGLVIALATAAVLTGRAGDRWRSLVLAGTLGLAVGLVRAVHTWDFPAAALIAAAGLAGGQILATGPRGRRACFLLTEAVAFGTLLVVPLQPYTHHTEVFNQGLGRAPETTPLYQFFAQFGVFAIVTVAYLGIAYVRFRQGLADGERAAPWSLPWVPGLPGGAAVVVAVSLVAAVTWKVGYATVSVIALLELVLLNLLVLQWRLKPRDHGALLATCLFLAGFAIAAGVDLVTVDGDIVRMNTVFKFSLQAWQLLALASGFAIWYVLTALPGVVRDRLRQRMAAGFGLAGAALLIATSSIYIVSGTPARLAARFPNDARGFDGLAYLDGAVYREDAGTSDSSDDCDLELADDRPVIEWLRANVKGSPVIVEAVGPLYHWTGRISMNTGLPAVIGWDWHQTQQRGSYAGLIGERRSDTRRFFRESDIPSAEAYLRKYNVSYVIVGTEERVYGTPAGLARLDRIPALKEVFREGASVIYQVDQAQLPPPTLSLPR